LIRSERHEFEVMMALHSQFRKITKCKATGE